MKRCLYCHKANDMKVIWNNVIQLKQRQLLCHACAAKLERIVGERCTICSRNSQEVRCFDCERWQAYYAKDDPLTKNVSIYQYNDFMKELIINWKYRGDYILGNIFRQEVLRYVKEHFLSIHKDMVIIPIPLSPDRLHERGFNQAEKIASFLNMMEKEHMTRILNEKQSKKTRLERLMTINPFKLTKTFNNPVLLVDDIYTTGRTLRHAAQLLKESGCPRVYALTLCRS